MLTGGFCNLCKTAELIRSLAESGITSKPNERPYDDRCHRPDGHLLNRVNQRHRRRVLLLIADDLNTWMLGDPDRYAGKVIAPNLHKLADSGVNFARAYTAAPVCSPSRTAFFSGVAPWTSGHYNNALKLDGNKPLDNATSIASSFKQAGYSTFSYGKITHGWDQKDAWDDKVGHKRDPRPPNYPLTSIGAGENDWGPIHIDESEIKR